MIYVCLNRTNPWLELSIKFHQYSVGAFHKALVELNNLWIHLVLKEFNWASMSKIPSSPFQMETSTRSLRGLFFFVVTEEFVSSFLIFSLIFFIIVDIGPMYHSFDERIWFTFIFSLSKRVTLVPIFFFFFAIYYVSVVVIKDGINKMHSKYFNGKLWPYYLSWSNNSIFTCPSP